MSDRYFSNSSKTGLETIDVPTGHDQSPREPERAKQLSGGIITGKAFQTDAVDPRIVIDSTGLIAHDATGNQTIKIDVTTGNIDVLFGSGVTGGLRWVDGTGALQGLIVYDTVSLAVPAFMIEGKDRLLVGAFSSVPFSGGSARASYLYVDSSSSNAGGVYAAFNDGTSRNISVQFMAEDVVNAGAAAMNLSVTDVSNRNALLTMSTFPGANSGFQLAGNGDHWFIFWAGSGESIDSVNGTLLMSNNTTEKDVICIKAAFTCTFGCRWTAAAGGNGHGISTQYRQVRGNSTGARVTPGAWTLTTVINNTNATGPAIGGIRAESAELTMTATAAGTVIYRVAATAS